MIKQFNEYFLEYTDRFNCRWMCKRAPEVWAYVLDQTSFLDADTVLPAQRCWHVKNNTFVIPLCPVTGKQVKWMENRYQTYSGISASRKCPELQKKLIASFQARTGSSAPHWSADESIKERKRVARRTGKPYRTFKRSETWHSKIKAIWDAKFPKQPNCNWKQYRRQVVLYSNRNYKRYKDLIPDGYLPRGKDFHLDHIFSVADAYQNGVDPNVVAHWSNLRIIPSFSNISKCATSHKTLEQLFEDCRQDPGALYLE